jgi:plastocyanin
MPGTPGTTFATSTITLAPTTTISSPATTTEDDSSAPRPPTGVQHVLLWGVGVSFIDASLVIRQGDTVTWRWVNNGAPINVVSGLNRVPDGRFFSGVPAFSGTFSFRFDVPGRYFYFSRLQVRKLGVGYSFFPALEG